MTETKKKKGGRRVLSVLLVLALLGIMLWAALMGMVWWKETHVPQTDDYDAIVVLGAQVKPDGTLSVQLQWRLDAAFEAWQKKQVPIFTCGAQGNNEPAPEGKVMRDYLLELGVPEDMVMADTESFNTRQNLQNAARLMEDGTPKTVVIVTSDYHLPRAMALAEDEGLIATGLGSPTKPEYWLKNHAREAISWVKYWVEKYTGIRLAMML